MTARDTKKADRTYRQFCPIAVGLDLIGDRWTLLICRELTIGDQRFTDLRNSLPGIAPNLLTERLRSLQAADLVTSVELPPPAARTVYRLTDAGREVRPILRALSRFGVGYLDGEAPENFTARRAANSLLAAWRRSGGDEQRVRLELDLADATVRGGTAGGAGADGGPADAIDLVVTAHDTQIVEPAGEPDVVVRTTADALIAARQGAPLRASLTGTAPARRSFLATFQLDLAS